MLQINMNQSESTFEYFYGKLDNTPPVITGIRFGWTY